MHVFISHSEKALTNILYINSLDFPFVQSCFSFSKSFNILLVIEKMTLKKKVFFQKSTKF